MVILRKRKMSEYSNAESQAYEKLFTYIKTGLLQNPRVVRMAELYSLFTSFFKFQGFTEIKESARSHFEENVKENLETDWILKTFLATNAFLLFRVVFPDWS